ncbi:MAG: transcription factor TFIIIC subunit tfc4 [Phylliscum demangeonii]|nr:MAG: transcription factor TFIIIC subunit tfc4 [Phylliscum demangeonii]
MDKLAEMEYDDPSLSNGPYYALPEAPRSRHDTRHDAADGDEVLRWEDGRTWDGVKGAGEATAPSVARAAIDPTLWSEDESDSSEDSNPDEEYFTLQAYVDQFQRKLRRKQHGLDDPPPSEDGDPRADRRAGKRVRRAARGVVEPSLEIKLLLVRANESFIARDYDRAEELATKVIQMNAETYSAHALLSGIFLERGETQMGIVAQMSAAHLRPKDTALWRSCVNLILDKERDDRSCYTKDAIYCLSRMVRIDPKDVDSRYRRALLLRELGHNRRAVQELEHLLLMLPHDGTILRQLAEIYVDLGDAEKAKAHYHRHLTLAVDLDGAPADNISWSDINVFVELCGYGGEFEDGIVQLKTWARWLLGRDQERCWDHFPDDDREWDAEDAPRRTATPGFTPGRYGRQTYGEGLPMELRVKLGIFRLRIDPDRLEEVLSHFEWLRPDEQDEAARLHDYPDLFMEAARNLLAKGAYAEALRYFEPLQHVGDFNNEQLYLAMAQCYRGLNLTDDAEHCYKTVIQNDPGSREARIQLAKMYEALDMPDMAFAYVNQVLHLERKGVPGMPPGSWPRGSELGTTHAANSFLPPAQPVRGKAARRRDNHALAEEQERRDRLLEDAARVQHVRLQALEEDLRAGDEMATLEWMEVAGRMIEDFRSTKVFYPWDRYIKFIGYSGHKMKGPKPRGDIVAAMEAMGNRLQASIERERRANQEPDQPVPTSFRGIDFTEWLDIFLRYALGLAKEGDGSSAYDVISAAHDANVFYHSPDAVFLIHVCWAACAVLVKDDKTVCNVSRWFMRDYQFTTDAYRLHAALNRICRGSNTWYNSGPAQKFMLRQVKAMDYPLVSEEKQALHFAERAAFTGKVPHLHPATTEDMDVALLVLYGHMLYTGTSYPYALNYFLRAYALDPTNSMVILFIALSYLHCALKRQSSNRHHLIVQGLSFLYDYHRLRSESSDLVERQEAEYNVGRAYHTMGLTHLAMPYYEKVLQLSRSQPRHSSAELAADATTPTKSAAASDDFVLDAAFNLQHIYMAGGNLDQARAVTQEYLAYNVQVQVNRNHVDRALDRYSPHTVEKALIPVNGDTTAAAAAAAYPDHRLLHPLARVADGHSRPGCNVDPSTLPDDSRHRGLLRAAGICRGARRPGADGPRSARSVANLKAASR